MNPEIDTTATDEDVELSESVDSARASNLRDTNPELYGEAAKVQADAAGEPAVKPDAAEDDAAEAADAEDTAQKIPRARLNEVIKQKNDLQADRDALNARLEAIEHAEQERARAAAEAAKAPPRDIKAEMAEVKRQFRDGELDEDERDAAMEPLQDALSEQRTQAAVAAAMAAVEQRDATRLQQSRAAQWTDASTRFMAAPENAAYSDPIRIAALNEAMKVVDAAHPGENITYDQLLQEARDSVEVAFGGKPSKVTETAAQRVARERRTQAATAAATASAIPDRPSGGAGARSQDGAVDPDNISRNEWKRMSQAQKDEALGKTPATT